MKASTFVNSRVSFTKLKEYLHSAKQWFYQTPERALEQAYQAALNIKSIENECFDGGKISDKSANENGQLMSGTRPVFDTFLNIAKLRLAEFKVSHLVISTLSSADIEKLKLINEVLAKYIYKNQHSSLLLLPVSQAEKNLSSEARSQPDSVKVDLHNTKNISHRGGIMPKSITKTINRVKEDLSPHNEVEVVNKIRSSRKNTKIAVQFIIALIVIPLLTQHISKEYLVRPIVDKIKGVNESQIFINWEMKEEALQELHTFKEELEFDSLIYKTPEFSPEVREEKLKHKAEEIFEDYHTKGNNAISNVFADLLATLSFVLIIFTSQKQVLILKSFLSDIVSGLSDSAKAFLLILVTDIFVGFHSPHGWEVLLEGLANHLGLPASRNLIFLFIATVPVVLDTMFKYWIFRYMSSVSPSAFATLKTMNE